MKGFRSFFANLTIFTFLLGIPSFAWSGIYETSMKQASSWLANQQNDDGSWGSDQSIKFLYTSEAAKAFKSAFLESPAYFKALTWLENHYPSSFDYKARRIEVLAPHGDDLTNTISELIASQNLSGGWGLSDFYNGSPLDTALILASLDATSNTNGSQEALSYLVNSRISGPATGWPLSQDTVTDKISTAIILRALIPHNGETPEISSAIVEANNFFVNNSSTGSTLEKAHTAVSVLMNDIDSFTGETLLDNFVISQSGDGHWEESSFITALVIQAMALKETAGQSNPNEIVSLADANLHSAVASSLGKNRADSLRRGDLSQVTNLDLSGKSISSLSGLDAAINLASLTFDVGADSYVGSGGDSRFAGIIQDLQDLDGTDLGEVNLTLNGTLDDGADDVEITYGKQIQIDPNANGDLAQAIDLNGNNLFEPGEVPQVSLGDVPLIVDSTNTISDPLTQVIVQLPQYYLSGAHRINLVNAQGNSGFEIMLEGRSVSNDLIDEDFDPDPAPGAWTNTGNSSITNGKIVSDQSGDDAADRTQTASFANKTEVWTQFDVTFSKVTLPSSGNYSSGTGIANSSFTGQAFFGIYNDAGTIKLRTGYAPNTTPNIYNIIESPAFVEGKTYHVTLHWKASTNPTDPNGVVQFWVGKELVTNISNADTDTKTIAKFAGGSFWDNDADVVIFVDNVVVGTSGSSPN